MKTPQNYQQMLTDFDTSFVWNAPSDTFLVDVPVENQFFTDHQSTMDINRRRNFGFDMTRFVKRVTDMKDLPDVEENVTMRQVIQLGLALNDMQGQPQNLLFGSEARRLLEKNDPKFLDTPIGLRVNPRKLQEA